MSDNFRIGAFNIQRFGPAKAENKEIMSVLARTIRRFDIILIQEICDQTGEAVKTLLQKVNTYKGKTHQYKIKTSDRLGEGTYKEQYAFFYRSAYGIKVVDQYHYDGHESGNVNFLRGPFIVHFKIPQLVVKDIAMIAIHVCPRSAVAEVKALSAVVDEVITKLNVSDVMILGDLNADCKTFAKSERPKVSLRTNSEKFFWPIDDSVGTTTGQTNCAYDRFVLSGQKLISVYVKNTAGVYKFDKAYQLNEKQTLKVSDHYPIELQLHVALE